MPEIIKISHGLTIGDLKYGNAKPGVVEATLKPGETMEEALDELDERLTAWHKKRYPQLYDGEDRFQKFTSGQLTPTEVTYGPLPVISKDKDPEDDPELQAVKKALEEIVFREEAMGFLNTSGFRFHQGLQAIVNSKPPHKA